MNEFKDFIYSNQTALVWIACASFCWALIMVSNNKGIRWRISIVRFLAVSGTIFWLFKGETISGYGSSDILFNALTFMILLYLELFVFMGIAWIFGMKDEELVAKILGK